MGLVKTQGQVPTAGSLCIQLVCKYVLQLETNIFKYNDTIVDCDDLLQESVTS